MTYTQCLLIRREKIGRVITVTWLPSKFARVGSPVKINGVGDFYVEETYGTLPEYSPFLKLKSNSEWLDEGLEAW